MPSTSPPTGRELNEAVKCLARCSALQAPASIVYICDALAYFFAYATQIALFQLLGISRTLPLMLVAKANCIMLFPLWIVPKTLSRSGSMPFSEDEGWEEAVLAAFDAEQ
ncbi:carbonyl reductase 20beta-hydroxysteroid dehydrogenase related protein [Cyclospora cayetanensis]|uniref:Carbonyl reductase 20beta-hydroxysteroid dehydrogenase related protein n=1 Tax=Cyclospora cayetanensis TaxID=88456 RepID=A0A1D3D9C4_9EIME|nr:carbonyl reductase 20beta-hydroxysteroid dehydrogenase related protein [Cyclospora cayetanensis]